MPKFLYLILIICSLSIGLAQDVETIASNMAEKMYNPMDHGLEKFSCKATVKMTQPVPFALTFSLKMAKGENPEVKIIAVEPPEMKQFVGMIGDTLGKTVTQAFMGSFADEVKDKDNKVTVKKEKEFLVLTIESKKDKGKSSKLWLKDYIVVKHEATSEVPDPMNPGSTREVENELNYLWKLTKEEHRVVDKVQISSDFGENEFVIGYQKVKKFILPKEMVSKSELGSLSFKFFDYSISKK